MAIAGDALREQAVKAYKTMQLSAGWGLVLMAACGVSLVGAGPLNDTGIDFCREHATGTDTPVTATTTCQPLPTHGAQDARYGRDPAAARGVLPKVGASSNTVNGNPNGFDFSKISNSGALLPADAALGSGSNDWACTYDNNTGLMWEVKVNDPTHLRHQGHTYTWYDSVHNYSGNPGTASRGTCQTVGRCDTEKFVADVNTEGLCGHTDWRMPTLQELYNLVDRGRRNPAIDPSYFPNTPMWYFWSASPCAGGSDYAWVVYFYGGLDYWGLRRSARHVRLVRAGQ